MEVHHDAIPNKQRRHTLGEARNQLTCTDIAQIRVSCRRRFLGKALPAKCSAECSPVYLQWWERCSTDQSIQQIDRGVPVPHSWAGRMPNCLLGVGRPMSPNNIRLSITSQANPTLLNYKNYYKNACSECMPAIPIVIPI